ncbi:hypothetical protein MRB53_001658 [Persea americana]|uniref:Uncharacterized protein n=1 Tax=Persea americana TaxID=3435 RepID=A0ACC2MT88_PERAE|nr:hypothetical protein MRB53_001658 [Persea americana]
MASASNSNSMQTEPTQNAGLGTAMETTSERPEWLPEGWKMEVRTRDSGKTKGMKDRFYYDPKNNHRFRSKKEVEYFLQTGTIRRNTLKSKTAGSAPNRSPSSCFESPNQDGSILTQQSAVRFDFENHPAKVSWVLKNSSEGSWTPHIDNEEVPESIKRVWAAAMKDTCT